MSSRFNVQSLYYLALLIGGAFLLVGCKDNSSVAENVVNPESIVTQQTINHTIVQSLNGVRQSKMVASLMERHDMAREPFMEFPNGIEITTYDSIGSVASTIRANYAIYYEKRQIWEARGNVVGHNVPEERTLRTEQLFWDEKIGRIYSNVNSYVEQPDGLHFGQGFESDEEFHNWGFRQYRGRMDFDPDTLERSDTTAVEPTAPAVTPATVAPAPVQTPATPTQRVEPRPEPQPLKKETPVREGAEIQSIEQMQRGNNTLLR